MEVYNLGLLNLLFHKPIKQTKGYFKMLDGYTPIYTNYRGGIYEMLQTRAIINTIATDCAKAIPKLYKQNKKLSYMLEHQPNPYMNTSTFIERVVTNYLCDNNSFIVPLLDDYDRVVGLFPIGYNQVEAKDYNGDLYLEYTFPNGEKGAIEYSMVGHLRRMQYKSDLFGATNDALNQTLEVVNSQNQAVTNALKQSGFIRFMAQLNEQLIGEEDFIKQKELFSNVNFGSDNKQMMIYDSRYKDIKQIESKPIYLDKDQQDLIDNNMFNYFGVTANCIQHKFTNDYEWNSYYEGVIEPILIKLSESITSIIYTSSQIMAGNKVYLTTNRLQYMSNQSKLEFSSQMFDRGIISQNDVCDVWNLEHFDGGEKHYIRKEYAEISKLEEASEEDDVTKVTLVNKEDKDDGKEE